MKNPLQRCGLLRRDNQILGNTRKQIWFVKSSFLDLFFKSIHFCKYLNLTPESCFSYHLQTHPKKNSPLCPIVSDMSANHVTPIVHNKLVT